MVDLRTVSTSGIPATAGNALRFFDLWVAVPEDAPGYKVRVKVYANGERIGITSSKSMDAGIVRWDGLTLENYKDGTYPDHWSVQTDWKNLEIVVAIYDGPDTIASSSTPILLAPEGDAWLLEPPNLSFASVVYSINDGPPLVLDLRTTAEVGLGVKPGDTLTILEIWYNANAGSEQQTVSIEAFLSSNGYDPETDISTLPSAIRQGIHRLPDVSPLTWSVSADKDNLVLWLIRSGPGISGPGKSQIADGLTLPLASQESPGLIRSSEAVLWPFDRSTFLDFERDSDFADWESDVADFRPSSDYAFTGRQSLQVSFSVTETSPSRAFIRLAQTFDADVLVAHYYLPSEPNVYIEWLQFCIIRKDDWNCSCNVNSIHKHSRDRWDTVLLDFSKCPEDADPPWSQLELSGFAVQGKVQALGATDPVSYTIYLDAIQILEDDNR